MKFDEYVTALLGEYNENLNKLVYESTERIFYLRKHQNNELKSITPKHIVLGRFYLIKYNYNDNKLFCPIFTIDFKNNNGKNILYAINLDYLPYSYKIDLFSEILNIYNIIVDKNVDINNVKEEHSFKNINFENVYKLLVANGNFNFAITAFDIFKIKECNVVSTNIVHRFIFLNTRMINSAIMKHEMLETEVSEYKDKLSKLIETYDSLLINNENDTRDYYKNLRNFESNFKLYEN